MNKLGLYIHIPFCNKICSYCDFPKRVSKKETKEKYIDYLLKEIDLYIENGFDFKKISSVYIGGGTPSSLDLSDFDKLLSKIREILDFSKIVEFTIEVNPEDLNHEIIDLFESYNVNRISIGIQTLEKSLLKKINRDFNFDLFSSQYQYLKSKIANINFDVMYAIPTQTLDDLRNTLSKLMEFQPTHFSVYSLILEEKTMFYNQFLKGKLELVSEELELQMVEVIHKILDEDYPQYEISNYSKDFKSYHNLLYWSNEHYLGIGLSAASYIGSKRYQNTFVLSDYFKNIDNRKFPIFDVDNLSTLDTKKHHIIQGFRKVEGISLNDYFNRFNTDIFNDFPKLVDFIKSGYFEVVDAFIRIKKEYLYVMDHFIEQLM